MHDGSLAEELPCSMKIKSEVGPCGSCGSRAATCVDGQYCDDKTKSCQALRSCASKMSVGPCSSCGAESATCADGQHCSALNSDHSKIIALKKSTNWKGFCDIIFGHTFLHFN